MVLLTRKWHIVKLWFVRGHDPNHPTKKTDRLKPAEFFVVKTDHHFLFDIGSGMNHLFNGYRRASTDTLTGIDYLSSKGA
jgi:hypothetical protein